MSDVATDFDFEGPAAAPRRPWRDGEGEARPAFDHSGRARHGADAEDGPSALRAEGKKAQGEISERTISPIAGRFGLGKGGKAVTVAALSVGCGVLYFASLSHGNTKHHAPKTAPQPVKESVDYASTRNGPPPATGPTLAQPGPNAPSLTGAPGPGEITPDPNMVDASGTSAGRAGAAGGPVTVGATRVPGSAPAEAARRAAGERLARLQAIRSAPLMAYGASRSAEAGEAGVQSGVALVSSHGDGAGATELDQLRRGSNIGMVKAQRLPDRNFLVVAGALLPCTLETAMDTSAPGYVTCRISRDVYSDNGSVVLMEKGSRVLGDYRSGQQQGRRRIFVLWNRIVTPDGVAVDVSSPASDALGRAGFDGVVDTHFWDRFGGALLMSAVGDGLSGVAAANARYGAVVQAPREAAAVALQNSVNIPPTLRKAQGSEVAIFVSRDLDFSGVYALKAR